MMKRIAGLFCFLVLLFASCGKTIEPPKIEEPVKKVETVQNTVFIRIKNISEVNYLNVTLYPNYDTVKAVYDAVAVGKYTNYIGFIAARKELQISAKVSSNLEKGLSTHSQAYNPINGYYTLEFDALKNKLNIVKD